MQAVVSKQLQSGMLIMFSAFALSVLAASFVVVPVKERISGSLHVQVRAPYFLYLQPLKFTPANQLSTKICVPHVDMLMFSSHNASFISNYSIPSKEGIPAMYRKQVPDDRRFYMALFSFADFCLAFSFIEEDRVRSFI